MGCPILPRNAGSIPGAFVLREGRSQPDTLPESVESRPLPREPPKARTLQFRLATFRGEEAVMKRAALLVFLAAGAFAAPATARAETRVGIGIGIAVASPPQGYYRDAYS